MGRSVFVGAVDGSRAGLLALIHAGCAPSLVVTLPPQKSDRHSDFADLTSIARIHGLPVHHTSSINSPETIAAIRRHDPDLTLVVGWSQICRQEFRSIARDATIGFHPAPLPKLRGRAVIPWTILLGETVSGSTLFILDDGVDSGPIVMQRTFRVGPEESARSLYEKHKRALVEMLPEAVRLFELGEAAPMPQDEDLASYCAKRTPEDGVIDWTAGASSILRLIRAVGDPYPGAFTYSNGQRLTIWEARMLERGGRYIGLSGQVQCVTDRGFAVRCGDGRSIEVTRWSSPAGDAPKVHSKLGLRELALGHAFPSVA